MMMAIAAPLDDMLAKRTSDFKILPTIVGITEGNLSIFELLVCQSGDKYPCDKTQKYRHGCL